jgi:hypothetical protein
LTVGVQFDNPILGRWAARVVARHEVVSGLLRVAYRRMSKAIDYTFADENSWLLVISIPSLPQ